MIDTIGMTDIGNGRPSNQDAYLLRQKEKNGKLYRSQSSVTAWEV